MAVSPQTQWCDQEIGEPFKRLGADRVHAGGRGGVGLGLAVVRSIVLAHQGTISARPRTAGGLVIEVALPGRAPAASPSGPLPA